MTISIQLPSLVYFLLVVQIIFLIVITFGVWRNHGE